MNLVKLLWADAGMNLRGVTLLTCLAGLGNAGLIGLINSVAERAALGEAIGPQLLLAYGGTFLFFFIANRASLREANRFVQHRLGGLRRRVVSKIRRTDLRTLERLGEGEIYTTVAQETDHLAQSFPLLVSAAQSGFLLAFLLLYIATLSVPSFLVVAGFTAAGFYVFWRRHRALAAFLAEVHQREAEMLDSLSHFTLGFQEIRLNADKNDALFAHFTGIVDRLKAVVIGLGDRWVVLLQFANAFLYALMGVVIFILPLFFTGYTDVIYKIVAAAIFALGPVAGITSAAHLYAKVEVGLGHVFGLERRLDAGGLMQRRGTDPRAASPFRDFRTLALEGVTFGYAEADGSVSFVSGPLDVTLRRGEVVFLTGGNGSGKSTALKLLCGLYAPDGGRVTVDGEAVTPETRQHYREIFSAIFTDFHLFDRLHGLGDVDAEAVNALIARMELSDKVTFEKGRFSTTSLSTGQRKRLAMIVSLLEDREVFIFDEWAADQDAHFRDRFYTDLLPDLRRRGKTVVAVTHDDRYWHCCDRRLVLDLGKVASEVVP